MLRLVEDAEPEPEGASDPVGDWQDAFDQVFWPAARKARPGLAQPKGAALALWLRIRPRDDETFQAIMRDFRRSEREWRQNDTEPRFIPHARKWLHDRIVNGRYITDGGDD